MPYTEFRVLFTEWYAVFGGQVPFIDLELTIVDWL